MNKLALRLTIICLFTLLSLTAQAETIEVSTVEQLRDAVEMANNDPDGAQVVIKVVGKIVITERFGDTDNALPVLTGNLKIESGEIIGPGINGNHFRLIEVSEGGSLELRSISISEFGGVNNGGAILVTDGGSISSFDCRFFQNRADQDGGAIAVVGNNTKVRIEEDGYTQNTAGGLGGAVSISGTGGEASIKWTHFTLNEADVFGCSVNLDTDNPPEMAVTLSRNQFTGACRGETHIENVRGAVRLLYNSFSSFGTMMDSTANAAVLLGNILDGNPSGQQTVQASAQAIKYQTEVNCRDFGSGAFVSLGHNISSDDSCSLDHPTDQPDTDPLIAENVDGLLIPQEGSPAIDGGSAEIVYLFDGGPAELPCGHRDVQNTARPQDANGDGIFECDTGAIEIPGSGEVVAGHSSAFFNPARNGEGNYVEILDDGRAVVYTFTYNPQGDGPAWFIGVGKYADNSIILDDLFRPTGATFGDAFNADDVEFTAAGSMSMVFPDCQATAPGGNVAYTGNPDIGYEGLITRATRLAHITGCGAKTPVPNAGLSGSFFDPARNGEGVIVEWLTNGNVLVVFFTYDPDGNQFWLFGQNSPDGTSVSINAIYPSAFTTWGQNFDADEVMLSDWGSFTLTWTDCNTVTFEYNSTVAGFGMGTRNYRRLSKLAGTSCPMFP